MELPALRILDGVGADVHEMGVEAAVTREIVGRQPHPCRVARAQEGDVLGRHHGLDEQRVVHGHDLEQRFARLGDAADSGQQHPVDDAAHGRADLGALETRAHGRQGRLQLRERSGGIAQLRQRLAAQGPEKRGPLLLHLGDRRLQPGDRQGLGFKLAAQFVLPTPQLEQRLLRLEAPLDQRLGNLQLVVDQYQAAFQRHGTRTRLPQLLPALKELPLQHAQLGLAAGRAPREQGLFRGDHVRRLPPQLAVELRPLAANLGGQPHNPGPQRIVLLAAAVELA